MVNKDAIHEGLTEFFIGYQWRLENPMPDAHETKEKIIRHYQTDARFNRKVRSLVSNVMHILDKHL